ncbi:MAG: N-formylglutamate amidohydrolase [Pseudomonadota bacterium]
MGEIRNHIADGQAISAVEVVNGGAPSSVVLVCEHASARVPAEFDGLGLSGDALQSHIAWDPGAFDLAVRMARHLDAVLIAGRVSRLVYDCNRPPDAPDAMPVRSEVVDVPGNVGLTDAQKADRVERFYAPFRAQIADAMAGRTDPILVTVHSFTPIYDGASRDVEVGVLHDDDARLADALLAGNTAAVAGIVRRNDPYGPEDGVTHTLRTHALPGGHPNVMLEIRNDLIAGAQAQAEMARALSTWLAEAIAEVEVARCRA